jgi:hypothetical protein
LKHRVFPEEQQVEGNGCIGTCLGWPGLVGGSRGDLPL